MEGVASERSFQERRRARRSRSNWESIKKNTILKNKRKTDSLEIDNRTNNIIKTSQRHRYKYQHSKTETVNMSSEIVYIIAEPGTGKTFNG